MLPALMGAAVAAACTLGACTVVPIGQEAQFTGATSFDAASEGDALWDDKVTKEVSEGAVDLSALLAAGDLTSEDVVKANNGHDLAATSNAANNSVVYAVKGTGTVTEVVAKAADESASSKGYITVQVDGYSGPAVVHIAVGPVITSTSLRDYPKSISLNDYKDTTEWSNVSQSINKIVLSDVVEPADIANIQGKKVTFTGAFTTNPADANAIDITPIELKAE